MLKKILLMPIAFALLLNAENFLPDEEMSCMEKFESCVIQCEATDTNDKDPMCVEKCEMLYDKCELQRETNSSVVFDISTDEEKEYEKNDENYINKEIEENSKFEDSIQKLELELSKD